MLAADVDTVPPAWTAVGTPRNGRPAATARTRSTASAGVWTYTLDNSNADRAVAQCRRARHADRHVHRHRDGRFRHRRRRRHHHAIDGANDAAVITTATGQDAGSCDRSRAACANGGTFPGTPTASGTLSSSDVDNPARCPGPPSECRHAGASGFGSYTIDRFDRRLDLHAQQQQSATVQALSQGGQTLTDTFTATTVDYSWGHTATDVVTITIHGTNDAPVITTATGQDAGTVLEAGGVNPVTRHPGHRRPRPAI